MANLTKEQVRQIIANRPPGTTPEGIVAALRENHTLEGYDGGQVNNSNGTLRATPPFGQRLLTSAKYEVPRSLPFAGEMAGGAVGLAYGGPGGMILGAGLGRASGEGMRQSLTQKNLDLPRMGVEGSYGALGATATGALGEMAPKPRVEFPPVQRTIPVKSKILDQYGNNFRKQVAFQEKAPPTPQPQQPITIADLAHLLSRRGLLMKLVAHANILPKLGRGLSGPIGRQSPRVIAELLRQYAAESASPDATQP